MNLAQLFKSQTLATLLQALDAGGELTAGRTVQARLASLEPDGTATAMIGETRVALILAGPQARQAALQPGATLLLRLDPPEQQGGDLRATLVEVRPPNAPAPGQAQAQPAPAPTPAQPDAAPASPASVRPPMASVPSPVPQAATPAAPAAAQAAHPPSPVAMQQAFLQQALQTLGPPAAQVPVPAPAAVAHAPAALTGPAPASTSPATSAATAAAFPAIPTAVIARAIAGPLLGPVLQRQAGLAPLFANLRALAQGTISLALPKTLPPAIQQVLAQAVPAERQAPTAAGLKQAFQASGLFLDTRQAAGLPQPRQGDLKAGLQALRETLLPIIDALSLDPKAGRHEHDNGQAVDRPAELASTDQPARLAPPRRDGPLALQPAVEPTLHPAEKPLVIAETLLDQTEAALDRIKLAQYASLPLEPTRQDGTQAAQRWLAEIPIAFHQGTAILPLQVERDAPRRDAQGVSPPLWRIRFALDVEPMGPLQGVVTLQGRDVGVSIWAEREETSQLLRGAAPGLEGALLDADFASGVIDIHTGQPRVMQPTAGQFLDRLS
ncbi:flagellar hook-length control protein FliK [Bosea robiniae]|uniref:Hook-length control protein FliK n=1 Tax=Bosea robiniae TaxID=1036780 RepID=A0ABY0NQ70_9HYPH|nr:flagellar hook-length control protein FliK [Bosea robiniae]SDF90295.1 hook-length control protein FliK [Bosea robiniae]